MLIPTPDFDLQTESTGHLRIGAVFFLLLAGLFLLGGLLPLLPERKEYPQDYSDQPEEYRALRIRMDERVREQVELHRPQNDHREFSAFHYFAVLSALGLVIYPLTPILRELRSRKVRT